MKTATLSEVSPTSTLRRIAAVALALVLALAPLAGCAQASTDTAIEFDPVTITRVVDGDTVVARFADGTEDKIRFVGVDTPEDTTEKEPYGAEATAYTRNALEGRSVYLEYDVELRDKYDRILAYVWLEQPSGITDGEVRAKMFNAHLLLDGYAQLLTIPPDVAYVDYFTGYEAVARDAGAGLWNPWVAAEPELATEPESEGEVAVEPEPEPVAPAVLDWSEARNHVGERVTIQGPVAGTYYASSTSGQPTFVNLGRDYPDAARLTILIWGEDRGRFPSAPESMYAGKTLRVTGTVKMYEGAAEIVVEEPREIVVVE